MLALICAIWFALAGTAWAYGAALIIAYPFGFASMVLLKALEKEEKTTRIRVAWIILKGGLMLSLTVLGGLLMWG